MTNIIETFSTQDQNDFTAQGAREEKATIAIEPQNTSFGEELTAEKSGNFNRTVPHGALHAERAEHKKTRAALAQLRAQHAQMLAELGTRYKQQEGGNGGNPPDPTQDFLAFTRWQAQEINQQKNQTIQTNELEKQANEERQVWQAWEQAYTTSKAQLPDLDKALGFLAQTRERQLSALAQIDTRFQDETARARQMQAELHDLVGASLEKGENPAAMIYELALGLGYGGIDKTERFKGLDQAQKAARTLAASNGHEAGDTMLMETLANLSEADFARWYEANPESFRRLFTD